MFSRVILYLLLTGLAWAQEVNYESVLVRQAVQRETTTGLEVLSRFTARGLAGRKLALTAFFYKDDDQPLPAPEGNFRASTGQLATSLTFGCESDYLLFDSHSQSGNVLFVPYSQLNLPVGTHNLKVRLQLLSADGKTALPLSQPATFTYTVK